MVAVPATMKAQGKPRAVGLLVAKELDVIDGLMSNPKRPLLGVMGGAKVSDKVKFINALLGKVDHLLIGDGQATHELIRAQIDAERREQVVHFAMHRVVLNAADPVDRLTAHENVLRDRQIEEQRRLLIDDSNPRVTGVRGPAQDNLASVHEETSHVRLMDAAEDFHQGRLAGPVLPDQRMRLAGVQVKRHIFEGVHAGKRLRRAPQRQRRCPRARRGTGRLPIEGPVDVRRRAHGSRVPGPGGPPQAPQPTGYPNAWSRS